MHQIKRLKSKRGFTMVELMIAMSFVAVLLVAIATVAMQMTTIYTRGVTVREVNQAGRYTIDVMTRDIAASYPFSVEAAYVNTSGGSRLCLGDVTYAWSSKDVLNGETASSHALTKYSDGTPVRFIRLEDAGASLCRYSESDGSVDSEPIDPGLATELISDGQRDLVVRDFSIEQAPSYSTGDTGPKLYMLRVVIGTNDSDYINTTNDDRCEPSADHTTNEQSYCAINEFKFVARASNLR